MAFEAKKRERTKWPQKEKGGGGNLMTRVERGAEGTQRGAGESWLECCVCGAALRKGRGAAQI